MSNTKNYKIKSIICSILLCFAMIISAFVGFNIKANDVVMADDGSNYRTVNVSSDLLSSYYNFNTTASTRSAPATPNGWSIITGIGNQVNKDNILSGIVDLTDDTTFSASTFKTSRPKNILENITSDTAYYKNLMINSHNGAGRLGYKSNSLNLEANSYYSISVRLYTNRTEKTDNYDETDAYASIYLSGLETEDSLENQLKFENINTLESWVDYTFYIDTFDSASVNLELWLGSKTSNVQGAVFFNNVTIYRYSEDYYKEYILTKSDTEEDNHNIISFSKSYTEPVTNSSFETTTPLGWTNIAKSTTDAETQICQIVDVNNYSLKDDSTTVSAPRSNNSANNNHALFMYNKEEGYQAIESSKFTVEQLAYYKISFFAKSNCGTGTGATVYLVDKSKDNAIDSAKLTLSTTFTKKSNIYRNDWTQYSFYVYGDELADKEVALQIWLGTNSSKTKGYVFVDDFRMEKVSYQTFSNNSSSSNSTSLNFNNESSSFVVVNSNFNKTQNEDPTTTYPLKPSNWAKSGDTNNNTFSGVIKATAEHFDANKSNYTNTSIVPSRPANHPIHGDNNNVLMIGSTSENNTQSYESDSMTLSANSYYKLSFYVFTDYFKNNETNNGARVTLKNSSRVLFDYQNINFTDNAWHLFETYIKTGNNSENANLFLSFEKTTGYVYFDDIKLETTKEAVYNDFTIQPNVIYTKVDLSFENFDNKTFNTFTKIQTPNNWDGVGQDSDTPTESGIISMNNDSLSLVPPTLSGNNNVLMINSLHNVNYAYTSKESFNFTAKTYYKITVNVLTNNLVAENTSDSKGYGASIILNGSKDIIVKGIDTHGVWKTYTIYLSSEDAINSTISLGLGASNQKISGMVLFDNLKIETTDQNTFLEDLKTSDDNYTKCFINYTEKTETDEEESAWTNDFNWLILPSLITALSIIIAVIGFYVKKINFNKKPKIKTKYDRRKTLDKDIDKREKIALRQQIIDELNAELKSIDDEIAEYNRLAEQKLEEMKAQILEEKQTIERKKLEIEIKKKEATAEREKQLKANPELVSNAKAEKEFERLLSHLDKQEMSLQKQINQKDVKLETTKEADKSNLSKFLERKEFIKNEIAKIEAEIEEIAKEEAEMWEEYKKAKMEAKQRKAEIKAQKVNQTPATKSTKNKATNKSSNKKSTQEKSEESQDQNSSNNSSK